MISQIDPTIIEASQQALRLLRGEESSTLNPLKNQRNVQRQKLLNSLREQLGPGAETSTAGIQALTRFDSESSNLFAGAQQQALGNMGNIGGQFSQMRPDMLRESMGLGQMVQNKSNFGINQANALSGVNTGMLQSAGANQTYDLLRGQNQQAAGNLMQEQGAAHKQQVMQMGGSMMGMMSDERLKENIVQVGVENGHNIYEFSYKNRPGRFVGVMAQEVLKTRPDAITEYNGFLAVRYDLLGIEFREVK
jgi:hypothetical protein